MSWLHLWREIERYALLPLRWLRRHFKDCRHQRQKCKVCGHADGLNFHVPDVAWKDVVPNRWQNRVVCLRCFDEFAMQKGIDYIPLLQAVYFVGEYRSFELVAVRRKSRF